MFSKQITTSDAFVDMPISSQLLYFHLNMEADDDGFVSNPKRITRIIGGTDDDLKILLAKRFLLAFASGVVVIKHWLLHNAVRKDMYKETQYLDEKKLLEIKDNSVYTESRNEPVTIPLHRLDKDRIDKVSNTAELPDWLDKKSWSEWEQYRKELGKKLTPTSIKKQISFLEYHMRDHKQIINQSITRGWTGLFEIKNDKLTSSNDAVRKLEKLRLEQEDQNHKNEVYRNNEQLRKTQDMIKGLSDTKKM